MKKQLKLSKIVIFLFIISCLFASFSPSSASVAVATYVDWSTGDTEGYIGAVFDSATSAMEFTFKSTINQGYLISVDVQVKGAGSPAGYARCKVYGATAYDADNNGTLLATSENAFPLSSATADFSIWSFTFDQTVWISSSQYYAFMVYIENATLIDTSTNKIYLRESTTAGQAGYSGVWMGATWSRATVDICNYIIVDTEAFTPTPTPAPTATPSPIPTTDPSGGIWTTLAPYGNILLPLVLILVVAIICGRFGGVWGFFAGLNVTVILIYVVMGVTYFPLWGIIMLAVVDAMLVFGKISGRV